MESRFTRTGTMRALACPFAILGRPTFLGLGRFKTSKLLYDCPYRRLWRIDGVTMKDCHVSPWLVWIRFFSWFAPTRCARSATAWPVVNAPPPEGGGSCNGL